MRRKLVLEIASVTATERVIPVQFTPPENYDCFIGEKMWEQRRREWGLP